MCVCVCVCVYVCACVSVYVYVCVCVYVCLSVCESVCVVSAVSPFSKRHLSLSLRSEESLCVMNARTPEPPAHTRHQASYAWLVLLLLVVTRTDGAADIAERWRAAECQLFFDREPACAQLHAAFDRCEQDANASRPARFRRQTCTREDLGAGGRGSAVDWGSGGLAATEIVVSAEFKFVYVVNRKAASSTVTNILKHVFGATAATSCRDGSEHIRKHGDRCVTTTVTEKMLDEYYFFTFVRDPVARFYSGIVQAFDGAMQFGAEHCREEMLDILDYIRETSRVPDVHLESQAHALSSPVYVRGLAGAIDFDFIGSADGVAEAFLVLFDKIEAHAGKKLTRRHRQLAFRLSLEKHNAAGSKSPEAARLVEMVTECRSRHRSSIDPEVRAVYQQDLVCGFDMAPTFADAVLTPATNEHVLHGDDHPAISLRLARDSLALLVDSNGALGVKLSVNVQGCVKGRPYLLRAFLKPLGSTHVHFWQQSFLGAKSVDVTRSFANVQRASRHRVVLSLDDLHPTHAVTEGGQADSLLARLDVTHELRAPDPAYTKPGLEEPARFSFAQLHGSSLIAWRQRETLITRRHRPFVAIVEPANNAVLLRECEGGYSSGHMIVRLDFSVGSLSELDMHQAPAEGGNYSVFIDGTLIASDVLFRKCPSNESMHKTLGYTRNGQMLCDERVNPAGTLSPLSIRKISVSMDKMNCASQHVVAVKYLVTDPISEVITRWSHFSIAPVPQTGLGQGAVLFDPPVTWLSSNFSTCAANVIVYETYSQVCRG